MSINKFVPNLYNNNIEMNSIINSEKTEFEKILELQIRNSFENTFIATADSAGLKEFEGLFNINADIATETLDFRRQRLWNLINTLPIYTEAWLKSKLDEIIKPGNWNYTLDYNTYTLSIYILRPGKTWLKELTSILTRALPCNILWTINLYSITWQSVFENVNTWQDLYDLNITWQELMEGEWIDE